MTIKYKNNLRNVKRALRGGVKSTLNFSSAKIRHNNALKCRASAQQSI